MKQLLLFPDPKPLVERLGAEFFREAPHCPGVYLMRDATDNVLYVGKAKDLRQRLTSYRVANPERLPRRQLRLLRAVARIELEECADETGALARESQLLRSLRPRYNRAGTWVGPRRFISWKVTEPGLELVVTTAVEPGWNFYGPLGTSAFALRAILLRLFWCALYPESGHAGMPHGWFGGGVGASLTVPARATHRAEFQEGIISLSTALDRQPDRFVAWIRQRTAGLKHPFEIGIIDLDLSSLVEHLGVGPQENCRKL